MKIAVAQFASFACEGSSRHFDFFPHLSCGISLVQMSLQAQGRKPGLDEIGYIIYLILVCSPVFVKEVFSSETPGPSCILSSWLSHKNYIKAEIQTLQILTDESAAPSSLVVIFHNIIVQQQKSFCFTTQLSQNNISSYQSCKYSLLHLKSVQNQGQKLTRITEGITDLIIKSEMSKKFLKVTSFTELNYQSILCVSNCFSSSCISWLFLLNCLVSSGW